MPITILSPYSGKPVKVRDQDVGRAIRDEEGRIFYIVDGTDGGGHYSSMTRKGSEKDEQRYRKLIDGSAKVDRVAREHVLQAHDATGKKRRNPVGMLVLLLIVLALGAAAYVYFVRPDLVPGLKPDDTTDPANTPTQPEPGEGGTGDGTTPSTSTDTNTQWVVQQPSDSAHGPAGSGLGESDSEYAPVYVPPDRSDQPEDLRHMPATRPIILMDLVRAQMHPISLLPRVSDAGEPVAIPVWTPGLGATGVGRPAEPDPLEGFRVMPSGLRYKVIERGTGDRAEAGRVVAVRYAVYTLDGEALLDDGGQTFILAGGHSIRALDEGLAGVRPGGQRVLFVPQGHSAFGRLPGLDALPTESFLLDVQLLSVRPGVTKVTEEPGISDPAMPGDILELGFAAYIEGESEPFDSSETRGLRLRLTLGAGDVIPGLEAGLVGIRLHETRRRTPPPYLAYGSRGIGNGLVPPDAVLTYRVTALSVERVRE